MSTEVIGRVVLSRAGRDAGRRFIVVGIADDAHVLLADGSLRSLNRPKKKKVKHLHFEKACMSGAEQAIIEGSMSDAKIRKYLSETSNKHSVD